MVEHHYTMLQRVEQPLHNVSKYNIAELLIKKGVDVNTKDLDGESCIHYIIYHFANQYLPSRSYVEEIVKTIQLLIKNGADVNAKNTRGLTPLDVAKELIDELPEEIHKILSEEAGQIGSEGNGRRGGNKSYSKKNS